MGINNWLLRKNMDRWLSLMLTFKCNLNCRYCLYGDRKETMPFEMAKNILKEAKELKFSSISLSGGEPSLYKQFREICDLINKMRLRLEIITNGTGIKHSDVLRQKKFRTRWGISLDSYDKDKNDELRGKGAFESALRLWSYVDNKDATFITLVTKDNLHDLPKIVHFVFEELGADRMTCYRAVPQGNAIHKDWIKKEEDVHFYIDIINKLNKQYKDQGKLIQFGCGSDKAEICSMIDSWTMFMPDGSLSPCCYLPQLSYFKYRKYGDLKHFFKTDYRTKLNERIDANNGRKKTIKKYDIAFCADCVYNLRKKKII